MTSSSPLSLCPVPPVLKPIGHYLKAAAEHANRDPIVTYWCRLAALQSGLSIDKKSKEALALLLPLMDWLEKEKKVLKDQEGISSEVVASAHIENYANKLFLWADKEDRAAKFGKNVVKSFYTAGILFDTLATCFELSPENAHLRKYAKWKAAHIHTCLKNGQQPIAGPVANMDDDQSAPETTGAEDSAAGATGGGWQQPQIPPAGSDLQPQIPQPHFEQHPQFPDLADFFPNPPAQPPVLPPQPSFTQPTPVAAAVVPPSVSSLAQQVEGMTLTPDQTTKAQKYCKYAISALDYDDLNTARLNLTKALNLVNTGREES